MRGMMPAAVCLTGCAGSQQPGGIPSVTESDIISTPLVPVASLGAEGHADLLGSEQAAVRARLHRGAGRLDGPDLAGVHEYPVPAGPARLGAVRGNRHVRPAWIPERAVLDRGYPDRWGSSVLLSLKSAGSVRKRPSESRLSQRSRSCTTHY